MSELVFLKLGGSLITDKNTPSTARPQVISRIAQEIAAARAQNPELKLLLGHGSGSFGHVAGKQHGTRQGVKTPEQWAGFAEVWYQACALNRIVIEALHQANLSPISFPASAAARTSEGKVESWDLSPLRASLEKPLLPVVFGDVAFDAALGGTILSTEDIFEHLARQLQPTRILLAGIEPGVYTDYPANTHLAEHITPQTLEQVAPALSGSAAADVTGGMASKVRQMLTLTEELPNLEVFIFSGQPPNSVQNALSASPSGTRLSA